jgi:hypothetical protein
MRNPLAAIGRFAAKPLAWGQASKTRVSLEATSSVIAQSRVATEARARRRFSISIPNPWPSFWRAKEAAFQWANGHAVWFGFYALVASGACGLIAGFSMNEGDPVAIKVVAGVGGMAIGYLAVVAIAITIFWVITRASAEVPA